MLLNQVLSRNRLNETHSAWMTTMDGWTPFVRVPAVNSNKQIQLDEGRGLLAGPVKRVHNPAFDAVPVTPHDVCRKSARQIVSE
jgi:hypothetical protein